jgi:hypothetical protein
MLLHTTYRCSIRLNSHCSLVLFQSKLYIHYQKLSISNAVCNLFCKLINLSPTCNLLYSSVLWLRRLYFFHTIPIGDLLMSKENTYYHSCPVHMLLYTTYRCSIHLNSHCSSVLFESKLYIHYQKLSISKAVCNFFCKFLLQKYDYLCRTYKSRPKWYRCRYRSSILTYREHTNLLSFY